MKRIILALMLIGSIGYTANRITNSDIASNAAIAFSKLAPLTSASVLVGNGSNVATQVGLSGDITLASSGAVTITNGAVALATDVTGTLPVANGGTGQTSYTDGQILIGNSTGNTLNKGNIIAGSGITVTNGSGSITISASGGGGGGGSTAGVSFGGASENSVCNSSPCTVYRANPSTTTVARTGSGAYTVDFGSFFTNTPICSGTTYGAGFSICRVESHPTANTVNFSHFTSGSIADGICEIVCVESE